MRKFGRKILLLGILAWGALSGSALAEERVPDWVFDGVEQLVEEGYIDAGGRNIAECSRKELVTLVAQGLHQIDTIQQGSLADEYGRISRLLVNDETQLKVYREQERYAEREYEAAKGAAKHVTEQLVRNSMQGTNRLEIMRPLQERSKAAGERLQRAARDYAQARVRVQTRELSMQRVRDRQQSILASMESVEDGTGNAMSLPPLIQPEAMETAARLRSQFIEELSTTGYTDVEAATQQLYPPEPVETVPDQRFRLDAEVRLDVTQSNGNNGRDGDESLPDRARVRARVYPDYNIDGNWHAAGMIEAEKTVWGTAGSDEGNLKLERYYLYGKLGVLDTTAGVFGTTLAEGNIYDSKFRGVQVSTGKPVVYTALYGSIDRAKHVAGLTTRYDTPLYGLDFGMYRFNPINGTGRTILMGNFRKPLGKFDLGVMALHGTDARAGNGTGYVVTLSHGKEASWRPRASRYWLKYYRQPSSTYISHTMSGSADNMSFDSSGMRGGFRGFGVGWSYTLKKDLVAGLEYYRLWDLSTSAYSNTIWAYITGFFHNYEG